MDTFRPWDADDEEYASLQLLREDFPPELRPVVRAWIADRVLEYGYLQRDQAHAIQSALRFQFTPDPNTGNVSNASFWAAVDAGGDKRLARVVDLLLTTIPVNFVYGAPEPYAHLKSHMDATASSLTIEIRQDEFRLARRLVEGVGELAQDAVDAAPESAGKHLAAAWREAHSLTPNASLVMTEAIRAVEAAAGPVVTPKDKRPRLGKIVQAFRDKKSWKLVLARRDDGHPDHQAVLIGMLETLAFAQQDRHSGEPPTPIEAIGHAQLAATLVGWFSSGVVVMDQ